MIFYNLIELESFIFIYFDSNLTTPQWERFSSWFKGVHWVIGTLLILGLYFSLYRTIAWLREKRLPKGTIPGLCVFTAVLMGLFLFAMLVPAYMPRSPLLSFWNLYVWPLNLLGMAWLLRLLSESGQGADPDGRRVKRALAWFFLLRIPVQFALLLMSTGSFGFWKITLSRLLILYTNLFPVYWLKSYFLPWAGSLGKIIGGRVDLPALQNEHGLSAREMEILNLMIDGKSYKEMEAALHISIHTVKSHVYSLYRKMKVKNRHQLIHMISTSQLDKG